MDRSLKLFTSNWPSRSRPKNLTSVLHICIFFKHWRFFLIILKLFLCPIKNFLCYCFGLINNSCGNTLIRLNNILLLLLLLSNVFLLYLLIDLIIFFNLNLNLFNLIHSHLLKLLCFFNSFILSFLELLLLDGGKLLVVFINIKIYLINFYDLITLFVP